ncbi:hypothetical protein QBC38DRAFT_523217 [Podospora fimiseda]|uniref:FecR protein domain-containing protein n=1 Tax=Podospora fimiseda TaxID=252190 RepID=A0AAN6YRJ5_9PEZI|nr:hypothetical protein QBC38DRAFT_523217 [Podospora fimiseda]
MIRLMHLLAFLALGLVNSALAQGPAMVNLGSAITYALFATGSLESNRFSPISGNVAIFPSQQSNDVRFLEGSIVGDIHLGDTQALTVFNDISSAYVDAASRTGGILITSDLGVGLFAILRPGVYTRQTTIDVASDRTLIFDAQNDPNAVFIIQTKGNLIIQGKAKMRLIGGASACRIFGQFRGRSNSGRNPSVLAAFWLPGSTIRAGTPPSREAYTHTPVISELMTLPSLVKLANRPSSRLLPSLSPFMSSVR